jgi:hypothetical protein
MSSASPQTFSARQAGSWLACLVVLSGLISSHAHAQPRRYRPPAEYVQLTKPDPAEGRRLLDEFRKKGIAGDYYLEFALRVLPRRGEERTVAGRMWGSRNFQGPISRVVIGPTANLAEQRLLVQNGPVGAVWSWSAAIVGEPPALNPGALFAPLAGTDLTAFDLQMPFLYWDDFIFEGVAPVRGRPAHMFLLYPPATIATLRPDLMGVRVALDTQFGALVQAQLIGEGNRILKSTTVLDLKKVDDQWIVKTIDLRDEATRNKTQFTVLRAALGLDFSATLFTPAGLSEKISPPADNRLRRVSP